MTSLAPKPAMLLAKGVGGAAGDGQRHLVDLPPDRGSRRRAGPGASGDWLTVGLLKEKMVVFGLAGGRHIDLLIARLCAVEYMRLRSSDRDRRVRILEPTERLRAHDRDASRDS
jgi:hypothetical protein